MAEYGREILAAKDICHKQGASIALVILVDPDGTIRGGSWGRDVKNSKNWKPYCDLGGVFLESAIQELVSAGLDIEQQQLFPDGWTAGFAPRRRWRLIGNAVIPAMAKWIGERIIEAETR